MKKHLGSQQGFSLVELMVVVGIIGLLAAIAVPQFQKFQAKARQTEAKTALSALYGAEKAFFSEYSGYSTSFPGIGYSPEGNVKYDSGFLTTSGLTSQYNGTDPLVIAGNPKSANEFCQPGGGGTGAGTSTSCTIFSSSGTSIGATALPASTVDATTFTAAAAGMILASGTADQWTIDQAKNMINLQNGAQ